MGSGKILIIHQQNSDCSALKSLLSRERYEVIEASLDMGEVPFSIEDCCVILMDMLAAAPSALKVLGSFEDVPPAAAPKEANRPAKRLPRRKVAQKPRKRSRPAGAIALGERIVHLQSRSVRAGALEFRLTRLECSILTSLLAHANHTVRSEDLVRRLWPSDSRKGVHSLRAFIKNLRKKIEADPAHPQYILTDLAVGYRLHLPPAGV